MRRLARGDHNSLRWLQDAAVLSSDQAGHNRRQEGIVVCFGVDWLYGCFG